MFRAGRAFRIIATSADIRAYREFWNTTILMTTLDLLVPRTNDNISKASVCETGISPGEIHAALNQILASTGFFRSHRMSRLLQFLVKKALADEIRGAREYAIGIEVFDRNPSTYSTYDDPIVRVQVGRLREKLHAYYAGPGSGSAIVISIPVGNYMPIIRRRAQPMMTVPETSHDLTLAVSPLSYFANDALGMHFASGLSEELAYNLFHDFSYRIVPTSFLHEVSDSSPSGKSEESANSAVGTAKFGIMYLLEGSIRLDADRMRASLRLLDTASGCIAWAAHFDRTPQFSISSQEELAAEIGSKLHRFFRDETINVSHTAR